MRIAGPCLLSVLLLACGGRDAATRPPSIVLVTLDTTRADRLGAYGNEAGLTPTLDHLAASGTVFEAAIAAAAVTPVSHASILTGLLPYTHGLRVLHGHQFNRLGPEQVTLAERLVRRGYATGAFVSAFPAGSYFGLDQGFEVFDEDFGATVATLPNAPSPVAPNGAVNTGPHQRRADETTDRALAWLESAAAPCFLWVHYFDPHDPVLLPPESDLTELPGREAGEQAYLRALYDREVAFMDTEIGRLLATVERRGDTIVAVVADHGEGLGDHGWWTHGILYQEQIHVPMLLAGPGVPAGLRVAGPVRTVDLAPTLLALTGTEVGAGLPLDGRDLRPLFASGTDVESVAAYADSLSMITYRFSPQLSDRKDDILFAMVDGSWKYIHHLRRPQESELYNLESDPAELHNRLAGEPQLVERMRRALARLPLLPTPDPTSTPDEADAEARRRLRALGYVD